MHIDFVCLFMRSPWVFLPWRAHLLFEIEIRRLRWRSATAHQSFPDNRSSKDPAFSREEAIRPNIILHLLSCISVLLRNRNAPESRRPEKPWRSSMCRKKPPSAVFPFSCTQTLFLHLHLLQFTSSTFSLFYTQTRESTWGNTGNKRV